MLAGDRGGGQQRSPGGCAASQRRPHGCALIVITKGARPLRQRLGGRARTSPINRPATPPTIPAIPLASVAASGISTSTAAIASTPSRSLLVLAAAAGPARRASSSGEQAQRRAVGAAGDALAEDRDGDVGAGEPR